jgi:hypothetical protein
MEELPSRAALSFLQTAAVSQSSSAQHGGQPTDYVAQGKKTTGMVTKLIGQIMGILDEEQVDEDIHLESCETTIADREAYVDDLKHKIEAGKNMKETASRTVALIDEEIKAMNVGIVELDKDISTATNHRQAENADFVKSLAANNQANELLEIAKNRLLKYYEGVELNERRKKSMNAIVDLITTIQADMKFEFTNLQNLEKEAQKDFEELVGAGSHKRAVEIKAIVLKQETKADLEATLVKLRKQLKGADKMLGSTVKVLENLHVQCDILIENHPLFKDRRDGAKDSLAKDSKVIKAALALNQQHSFRGAHSKK